MARPRARPRFTVDLAMPPDQVIARVRARLQGHPKVTGRLFRRAMLLTVRPAAAHFWSPQLDVHLADAKGGGTRLAALFAPHPRIWSAFVTVQMLFGLAAIAATVYLLSMVTLNDDLLVPSLALAASLVGGGLSYGAAYVGQGFGADQMHELRSFLEHALEI